MVRGKKKSPVVKNEATVIDQGRIFAVSQRLAAFLLFFLSPLIFLPGFNEAGQLFVTIYDLPKHLFLGFYALLWAFLFTLSPTLKKVDWARFGKRPLVWLLIGLFFLIALSGVVNGLHRDAVFVLLQYGLMTLLGMLLALVFYTDPVTRRYAVWGMLAALPIFSILAICQYCGLRLPLLIPILGPAATFGYRNPAAHYLALNLPFAVFSLWLLSSSTKTAKAVLRGLVLFAAGSGFVVLIINYSRTAILALALGLLAAALFWFISWRRAASRNQGRFRKSILLLFVVLLLGAILICLTPKNRERFSSSYTKLRRGGVAALLEFRYYHWSNTSAMIKDHPLLGVGPGNWRVMYPLYYQRVARDPLYNYKAQVRRAHNDYLQLAAEYGIPALLVFLFLWGRQFYLLRYPGPKDEPDWRLPLVASLTAFSVIMFFSFPLQMGYSRMFCFFLIAFGEARVWPASSS